MCAAEDVFVTICIASGLLCFAGATTDYFWYGDNSLVRTIGLDAVVGVGGILCFLEVIPCFRRVLTSGVVAGYAGGLAGLGAGFAYVSFSNSCPDLPIREFELVKLCVKELLQKNGVFLALSGGSAVLVGLVSGLRKSRFHGKRFNLCRDVIFNTPAVLNIIYCTAAAVVILWPRHSTPSEKLIRYYNFDRCLKGSMMLAGALISWTTLISTPKCWRKSCLRILFLVVVLLGHVSLFSICFNLCASLGCYALQQFCRVSPSSRLGT